jgi:ankyrin repeat protein
MSESGNNEESYSFAQIFSWFASPHGSKLYEALMVEIAEFCQSEYDLSEEGLREIVERHRLSPNNNHIYIDYKFFFEACKNERVTEGIIRCLLEYFPAAANAIDNNGQTPLHKALRNKNVTFNIVQLLIDAAPDSIHRVDNDAWMPLHCLCNNKKVDEIIAIEVLKLLIERCPEALRHPDDDRDLPIHSASLAARSPEFCRLLIEAYPGSEQIANVNGVLPLHCACFVGAAATVEYLYKLYPDAINHATTPLGYPIQYAIEGLRLRDDPTAAVVIVKFLLDCDPNVKLQKYRGIMPLFHLACRQEYNDSNIEAAFGVVMVIYDAHPEAIENNEITSHIHHYHQQVQEFMSRQLVYSRQAKGHRLMTTPDEKGQLPLHTALQNNVILGSIKLLVKGNPSAISNVDNSGALPLHLVCQHHDSATIVKYLLALDATSINAVDEEQNTALRYACRGAKYDTIAFLLDEHDGASVSKANAHNKLPIDLLWGSDAVSDRESDAYVDAIFRLLRAYPETICEFR